MRKKILVIEDHQDWITLYQDILGEDNNLKIVTTLSDLQKLIQSSYLDFDLVISDLKLPDGMFLDWIEAKKSDLMEKFPTIIVSSLEDMEILRTSFEWGATDYLIKPFKKSELIVKLEKAHRDYQVKSGSGSAKDLLEELTSMERKIFQRFLTSPNELITREKLTMDIWKKVAVHPKTIDVHLSNLRRKLNDSEWMIDNEHERGWRLTKRN